MGDIITNTMVTLNGVAGRPETWQFAYVSDSMMQIVAESLGASAGLLLGRRTYEEFVQYWPNADPEQNPLAPVMNGMPTYVVSSTLTSADWQNTHIVSGADGLVGLKALKDSSTGTLSVIGSPTLVRSLTEAGLVDRISLMVYPVVVDEGVKLFDGRPSGAIWHSGGAPSCPTASCISPMSRQVHAKGMAEVRQGGWPARWRPRRAGARSEYG